MVTDNDRLNSPCETHIRLGTAIVYIFTSIHGFSRAVLHALLIRPDGTIYAKLYMKKYQWYWKPQIYFQKQKED